MGRSPVIIRAESSLSMATATSNSSATTLTSTPIRIFPRLLESRRTWTRLISSFATPIDTECRQPVVFFAENLFYRDRFERRAMRLLETYLLLLTLPLVLGCGNQSVERVPVAGEVLIDGQPLGSGTIQFVPEQGRPSSATIQSDGRFELASDSVGRAKEIGAAPGRYRVQVASSKIIDDKTIQWNAPARY